MSSDGLRHEGEIEAPDKDSAYAELRKRGIRAIKVTERIQPIVRNGFAGLRKRDWTLALGVVCAVLLGLWLYLNDRGTDAQSSAVPANDRQLGQSDIVSGIIQIAQPRPRKWIELPADIDLAKTFKHPHEAFLARYAMPGADVSSDAMTAAEKEKLAQDFFDNLNAVVVITETDSQQVAEIKRIVAGMKDDAKKYLTARDGFEQLLSWLDERQTMERAYRNEIVNRVKRGEAKLGEVNVTLRTMGLAELSESELK